MWRRIGVYASSVLFLTLTRWMLHVSHPAHDLSTMQRLGWQIRGRLSGWWRVFWRRCGPITRDMRAAWAKLKNDYQGGAFGLEGT